MRYELAQLTCRLDLSLLNPVIGPITRRGASIDRAQRSEIPVKFRRGEHRTPFFGLERSADGSPHPSPSLDLPPALAGPRHLLPFQFRNDKIVYRRYAGLFFCVCVDSNDNELAYLEAIHLFVEVLGEPCGSHCPL